MGFERLLMLLDEGGAEPEKPCDVYIAAVDEKHAAFCVSLAENLRKNGISAETDLKNRSLKAQLKYADRLGTRYLAAIGEDEAAKGAQTLKILKAAAKKA